MRRIFMLLMLFCLCADPLPAAERKFPYDAVIDVTEEYVRSGNGRNYYPTSKLQRGDRVTVRRHDPGGWVMIDPTPSDFSWIKADFIRRSQGATGVLQENNVIVRIGSNFNDDHDWYQRELSKGDTVEILGEKTFETDRGPVKMLKIKPPANEYRWIMGKALRQSDAPIRKPIKEGDVAAALPEKKVLPVPQQPELPVPDSDPFEDGPLPKSDFDQPKPPIADVESPPAADSIRLSGPDPAERGQLQKRLSTVDDEFRTMIQRDPPTWDLIALEQQYRQLDESGSSPAFQTQLKLRLDAVERYSKIKQEYDEFIRLSTETKQRDAQLMSLKNQAVSPSAAPSTDVANSVTPPVAKPAAPAPRSPAPAAPATKKFDGAGIIQRSASPIPNAPKYVLTAPNGRLLSYLQPAPGVDLQPYVGQAMGVIGQRSYRQELQAELIIVRSLQPVRLRSGT